MVQVHSSKILLVQVRFGFIDLNLTVVTPFVQKKKGEIADPVDGHYTALIVRGPAPAASGYGKIYSYFC